MKESSEELAFVFKALGDSTRVKIIELLKVNQSLCGCNLLEHFSITQPTLSYHMKILVESQLVAGEKDGSWTHYRLNKKRMREASSFFQENEDKKE